MRLAAERMREKRTSLRSETLGPEDIIGKKRDWQWTLRWSDQWDGGIRRGWGLGSHVKKVFLGGRTHQLCQICWKSHKMRTRHLHLVGAHRWLWKGAISGLWNVKTKGTWMTGNELVTENRHFKVKGNCFNIWCSLSRWFVKESRVLKQRKAKNALICLNLW